MQMDEVRHLVLFLGRCDVAPLNGLFTESRSKPIERERQSMRALVLHGGFGLLIVKQRQLRSPLSRWGFQMIHANGHCAEADTPPEATKEQVFEMRVDIRFPPRARIEDLMLGDLDVIAMPNR
jgi:hypothetical protein